MEGDRLFWLIMLQLVLIAINAFFAASEMALVSLNTNLLRKQAEEGDKKAKKLLELSEEPTAFLSAIQIAITLAGFLGSAFAADNFADPLTNWVVGDLGFTALSAETINSIAVILITLTLSYFTLVLGELVPKRVAMRHKEKLAGGVCGIISFLTAALKPIIWLLSVSTNGILRLFGIDPHEKDEAVSEEDIVIMLDAGADEGTLNEDDIAYIKNVFKLDRLTAADVMTPCGAMVSVTEGISEQALLALIESEGYSRIPVYAESNEKIVGVLHVREYLLNHAKPEHQSTFCVLGPKQTWSV